MNVRSLLRKMLLPFLKRSKNFRYFVTRVRLYIDNRGLRKKRLSFYSSFIKKGDLCFDIGANYGNRVDIFLSLGAKVIAIEPQVECIEFLKRKYGNKIAIEQKGAGAEPSIKDFYVCDASVLSSFSEDFKSDGIWSRGDFKLKDTRKIEIVTLDSLITKYGTPAFIKIDVEGFEAEVLKGLSQKINIISFEYTNNDSNEKLMTCIDQLLKISNTILFNYSIEESMDLVLNQWSGKEHFLDLIKTDEFTNTCGGDIYVKFT